MRKLLLRMLLFLVALLVVGFVAAYIFIYRDWAQGPLPKHSGEITLSGLQNTVEIFRDEWGVPHIYASNTHDLFFTQGYTQAQDRWWQMEFFRHTASGTIQELTGYNPDLLGTDIFLRTLGFREVAQRELSEVYDDDMVDVLQAFADGVNAYISDRSNGDLAFEYNVLGVNGVKIDVAPWTPVDSLIWGKIMSWQLSGNQSGERQRSRLAEILDEDSLAAYFPEWPFSEKPTIIWPEELTGTGASLTRNYHSGEAGMTRIHTQLAGNFTSLAQIGVVTGEGIGSNNWVVTGPMSESGQPLMANDMHLGIQMPSIWYEIGLHCQPVSDDCPFDVVGFALSPTPAIIAGHNANIAWALTNVGPDTQDLYEIRVNPENVLQYEWNGEWRDMQVRNEVINFGDGTDPVNIQVRVTHLGPIINDNQLDDDNNLEGFTNENPLALRWTALDPGTILQAVAGVNTASNWQEFREAVQYWDTPAQNLIYADTQGNIGYQTPGKIPIRAAEHTGLLPVPGWTDEYEWLGYIPYENLPRIFNPERNFIATANQAVVPLEFYDMLADELGEEFGEDANYIISREWAWGYRGERVNDLIESLAPHNSDTFRQIQGDNYSGSAAEILPFLQDVQIDDAQLTEARDWLLTWDYQMHMDSPQAALYAAFWKQLVRNLYNDQLGENDEAFGSERWPTYLLLQEPQHTWWDDVTTDVIETRDDILLKSLSEAYEMLRGELGQNHNEWAWGKLHTTTFVSNPLGLSGIRILENMVNRGGVATSGDGGALNATSWRASSDGFAVRSGPSERVIYDLSDWTKSLSIHTTGQSGHPFSDDYDNMIDAWRNIEYRPMLWSRAQVEDAAVKRLVLTPAG